MHVDVACTTRCVHSLTTGPLQLEIMPKSRGAVKKYKTKVTVQKQKRVSKKLRTTLLPTAAKLWNEKNTVRGNYENLGISAEINADAAVATSVHTNKGTLEVRDCSSACATACTR